MFLVSIYRAWQRFKSRFALPDNPRLNLVRRFLRIVGLSMLGLAALFFLIQALFFEGGIFKPNSAQEVIEAIESPSYYVWASETSHSFKTGAQIVRQDSSTLIAVDQKQNKFQVGMQNVLPSVMAFTSDGNLSLRTSKLDRDRGLPWRQLTNPCLNQKALSASLVAMPSQALLLGAQPKLVADDARALGEDAWRLEVQPTPALVEQMLLLPFLARASDGAGEFAWAISPSESAAIHAGKFTVGDSEILITQKKPRRLTKVELSITLENGRSWHLLAALRSLSGDSSGLKKLNLGTAPCGS